MRGTLRGVCFHGVGEPAREMEPGEAGYWIDTDSFRRVLDEVMTWPRVSLSFDDGNASDIEIGLPELIDRGLAATFFPLGGRLDGPGSLRRSDVAELAAAGMPIGTHGMDHRPWRGLTPEDRRRELVEARAMLAEASGRPVVEAACPLGRYDRRVLTELRSLGYERVHTSDRRPARTGAWLQPRFSVHRGETAQSLRATVEAAEARRNRLVRAAVGVVKRVR